MFDYTVTVLTVDNESTFQIFGTSDKVLCPNTLLEILLSDVSFVCVQDNEGELGFYKHKYHKHCTSKIGHAL